MAERQTDKARYSVSERNLNSTRETGLTARRASSAVERARASNKSWAERRKEMRQNILGRRGTSLSGWKRETHTMTRQDARAFAKNFLKKYPKAAYWSEVESWRVLEGDVIEFTMRRLPSAD